MCGGSNGGNGVLQQPGFNPNRPGPTNLMQSGGLQGIDRPGTGMPGGGGTTGAYDRPGTGAPGGGATYSGNLDRPAFSAGPAMGPGALAAGNPNPQSLYGNTASNFAAGNSAYAANMMGNGQVGNQGYAYNAAGVLEPARMLGYQGQMGRRGTGSESGMAPAPFGPNMTPLQNPNLAGAYAPGVTGQHQTPTPGSFGGPNSGPAPVDPSWNAAQIMQYLQNYRK